MKKYSQNILLITLVVLALVGTVHATVDITIPEFGSENTPINTNVTRDITITNNFNEAINITSITSLIDARFNFNVTNIAFPVTVLPGDTTTARVHITLTPDLNAIDTNTYKPTTNNIGVLTTGFGPVNATNIIVTSPRTTQANIIAKIENGLEFSDKDIHIISEGTTRDSSLSDGKDITLKILDEATIELEVENLFDDREEIDFRNVKIFVKFDEEDGFEIDEDDRDIGKLGTENKETETFGFRVEIDAADGTTDVEILVIGETDPDKGQGGGLHGEVFTINLEIDRPPHQIAILGFEISPDTITCSNRNLHSVVTVRLDGANTGRSDERRVAMQVSAASLGFDEKRTAITIDEDNKRSFSFSIPLASDVTTGAHRITAESFYSDTSSSDREELTLTIQDCNTPVPTPPPVTNTTPPAVAPVIPLRNPVITQPPTGRVLTGGDDKETSFFESTGYLILLIGIVALLFIAILVMIGVLLTRKKN